MTTTVRWAWALGLAALLAGSAGCVTKGTYNELESERDQIASNRDDLQVQVDKLQISGDDLKSQLHATEEEMVWGD